MTERLPYDGVPGCAGCVDPVNMQHVEGCRLRAKALGHRHAEDIAGRALYVGDRVATLLPNYRYTLVLGDLVRITDKMLRVRITQDRHGTGKESTTEHTVADCQVAKVPR